MNPTKPYLLTIDDDLAFGDLVGHHVEQWGYGHLHIASQDDLDRQGNLAVPAAVLLDIYLGQQNGLALLPGIRQRWPDTPVFIATTAAAVPLAVEAMRLGAYDYLVKPLDIGHLEIALRNAVEHWRTLQRLHDLEASETGGAFADLVGDSPALRKVFRTVSVTAPTDVPILLLGETGTGKELVARAIHRLSGRSNGPFIAVNCAAMPATLVESTLFGSERGAYTGAYDDRAGCCQQADGGTLFFDEIGELPIEIQPKLLRFLQDRVVMPVGASVGHTVDVRIVAATNRDPAKAIAAGHLREDLFYRLNVVSCTLPPLRERRSDIPLLSYCFLKRAAQQYQRPMTGISPAAMAQLMAQPWPGNVRELENRMIGIVVRNDSAETLEPYMLDQGTDGPAESLDQELAGSPRHTETIEEMEKRMLVQALHATEGDVREAASQLGISQATVYRKIKRFGISTTGADLASPPVS